MSDRTRGHRPLSPVRRNLLELMRLSRIPLVTAERQMELAELAQARQTANAKIAWSLLFMKAFAIVAARQPALRTAYMSYPSAHHYEHSGSIGTIMIEREHEGEVFPLNCRFRNPEQTPLLDLHQALEMHRVTPLEDDAHFQRLLRVGRLPWLLRRLLWSYAYHHSGKKRAHYFGTFGLSSPAASGAGLTTIVSPLACTLHYGLFDEADRLAMRLTFDHRAIDGAPVARALKEMELVLTTEILDEIRQLPAACQAA